MSLLDILFGHAHKYTRVFTLGRGFKRRSYQVCVECGKEFEYDLEAMRVIGEVQKAPIQQRPRAQVVEIGEFRRRICNEK